MTGARVGVHGGTAKRIAELWAVGLSRQQIAIRVGIKPGSVSNVLNKSGLSDGARRRLTAGLPFAGRQGRTKPKDNRLDEGGDRQ